MKRSVCLVSLGLILAISNSVFARDSLTGSAASTVAVSMAPASIVVVSAYVGSVMVVESIRVIGDVVEVILKGAANASRAVVTVTADSVKATSIAVGQSVKVVAEGSGYLLVAGGKVLCYVPGQADQALVRSTRSN